MIELDGQLFDGQTSRSRTATLRVWTDGTVRIAVAGSEETLQLPDLEIPARLGNTPRRIRLPNGAIFETPDNAGADAILADQGRPRRHWLHRLESRWDLVLASAVFVLGFGAAFVVWGVPALARVAAFAVPAETSVWLGEGTLEILDRTLEPSSLPDARREALRARLDEVAAVAPGAGEYAFRLVFRGGGEFGANALALPSGQIVVTDELVALADADEELVAVLAHEVGHVVHRHALRQAIQSSTLVIAIVLVTGDLSATSGSVAALPTFLAEARFSKEFEREADAYAVGYLDRAGIDEAYFARILRRLDEDSDEGFASFFSTHPNTEERIRLLERGDSEEKP